MTIDFHNPKNGSGAGSSDEVSGEAEKTLRLIAGLPAPQGLEKRVHQRLSAAQQARGGRVLAWPAPASAGRDWMRTAAAAAIAFLIVGGGWGVYRQVQPGPSAGRGILLTPHGAAGGFAGAGAMRTPQTLNGPVVNAPSANAPVMAQPVQTQDAQSNSKVVAKKETKKNATRNASAAPAKP